MNDNEHIREEDLHFHYNREDRIKRAPEIVRAHYDGTEKTLPKGFFKSLVHTKSSRFLLGSIILLIIMILFVTNINIVGNTATVKNISFELSAFTFEDTVFVSVKAHEAEVSDDISLSVYFIAHDKQETIVAEASIHSIFDGNENFYRTTFSKYDIMSITCDILVEDEIIQLKASVKEE